MLKFCQKLKKGQPTTQKSKPPYLPNGKQLGKLNTPSDLKHLKMGLRFKITWVFPPNLSFYFGILKCLTPHFQGL
jgi:hypothetical protein